MNSHSIEYLCNEGSNPYSDEDRIAVETFEDVSLTMNFSSVDFIKQSHHDECVENNREMLGRFRMNLTPLSVINIEQQVAWNYNEY